MPFLWPEDRYEEQQGAGGARPGGGLAADLSKLQADLNGMTAPGIKFSEQRDVATAQQPQVIVVWVLRGRVAEKATKRQQVYTA